MDTTMKQFKPIDPLSIKSNPNLIGSLPGDTDPSDTYCLLVIDTHAIIFDYVPSPDPITNEPEWLPYQLEFPKADLRWIVDTTNNKSFKTPDEGGLPVGVYHYNRKRTR